MSDTEETRAFLAARREAASKIDAETAEVMFDHGVVGDPYDIRDLAPDEEYNVGRRYFARDSAGGDWVSFGDLPGPVREALWAKHGAKLAFPASPALGGVCLR
jgi:hypothetical protein